MSDLLSCFTQASKNLPIPKVSGKSLSVQNVLVGCALVGVTYVVGSKLLGNKEAGKLVGDQIGKLFK